MDAPRNWGVSVERSRGKQSTQHGALASGALRDAVLVLHDDGPLTEAVCRRFEAAPWNVVRARVDHGLPPGRSRPTLVVVVVAECSAAEPVVRSVGHVLARVPLLVLAGHVTPQQRQSLMLAGASDCVAAGAIALSPEAVLAERVLEMDQLRRRLEDVTEHERARAHLARRLHETLSEKLDLLRATASSVLISLRALRAARTALLTSGEATVVDSLCTSVESMFPLFDTIDGTTPVDGYPTVDPAPRGPAGHLRRS